MDPTEKREQWEEWKEKNSFPEYIIKYQQIAKEKFSQMGYRNTKSRGKYLDLDSLCETVSYSMYKHYDDILSDELVGLLIESELRAVMSYLRKGQSYK